MNINWQDATAMMAVAAAGGYLARRMWFALVRKRAGCGGGCSGCPSSQERDKAVVVIQIPLRHQPPA